MNYCTRCDRPLHDGEVCKCGLPERILLPPVKKIDPKKKGVLIFAAASLTILAASAYFDLPMLRYSKGFKQRIANQAALEISAAAQTAINSINQDGQDVSGEYTICYNSSDDSCVPFESDLFDKKFKEYAGDDIRDDYVFFIRVKDGAVTYTAASTSWHNNFRTIGTCPPSSPKESAYTSDLYEVEDLKNYLHYLNNRD